MLVCVRRLYGANVLDTASLAHVGSPWLLV